MLQCLKHLLGACSESIIKPEAPQLGPFTAEEQNLLSELLLIKGAKV